MLIIVVYCVCSYNQIPYEKNSNSLCSGPSGAVCFGPGQLSDI